MTMDKQEEKKEEETFKEEVGKTEESSFMSLHDYPSQPS